MVGVVRQRRQTRTLAAFPDTTQPGLRAAVPQTPPSAVSPPPVPALRIAPPRRLPCAPSRRMLPQRRTQPERVPPCRPADPSGEQCVAIEIFASPPRVGRTTPRTRPCYRRRQLLAAAAERATARACKSPPPSPRDRPRVLMPPRSAPLLPERRLPRATGKGEKRPCSLRTW